LEYIEVYISERRKQANNMRLKMIAQTSGSIFAPTPKFSFKCQSTWEHAVFIIQSGRMRFLTAVNITWAYRYPWQLNALVKTFERLPSQIRLAALSYGHWLLFTGFGLWSALLDTTAVATPLSWSRRRRGKEVALLEQAWAKKMRRAFLNEELSEL